MKRLIVFGYFLLLAISSSGQNTKRVALVIGAQNYTTLPALRNSLNDARSIHEALQKKGFTVNMILDPKSKKEMKDGINWYYQQMDGQVGATGLIYYAGHGMQYQGDNYMIPTSAALANPGDLEEYCLKMNTIMAILNATSKSLNILLLDACRSLPSFTRDVEQGLTKMSAPEGTIVVFAAQAGKVASDGNGTNGLFTSKLLNAINEPGLNITDVFQKVKREVYTESKQMQLPSVEDNTVGGHFYFTQGAANPMQDNKINTADLQKETKKEAPILEKQPVVKKETSNVTASENLFGIWQNSSFGFQMTLMLNEDGSGEFDGEAISFKTENNRLSISQFNETTHYSYALNGNAMTLSGGDLDTPITFSRIGNDGSTANGFQSANQVTSASPYLDAKIVGSWSGNGETIEFNTDGQCIYLGYTYQYVTSQGYVTLQTMQGNLTFSYSVAGNQLTLSANGMVLTYFRN